MKSNAAKGTNNLSLNLKTINSIKNEQLVLNLTI